MGWISSLLNLAKSELLDKPYQKGFWYEQQEYNSPVNQVARLREAGINPQMAIGNIQSGQMGSIPSAPNANVAAGVTDSILQLINNKKQQNLLDSQANKNYSDATLNEIDAHTRFAKNLQEISESMSREGKNKMEEMMMNVLGTAEEQLMKAQTANYASQNEINWLNYAKGMKELQFLPTQQRLEYVERMANIANIEARTESEREHKKKLIEETNWIYFKAKGEEFVNSLNKKTEDYLIHDRKMAPLRGHNPFGIFPALDFQFNY